MCIFFFESYPKFCKIVGSFTKQTSELLRYKTFRKVFLNQFCIFVKEVVFTQLKHTDFKTRNVSMGVFFQIYRLHTYEARSIR